MADPHDHAHHHHGHDHAHGHAGHGQWVAAAHATLHCSIGCIIGETIGLMVGTTFHFTQLASMVLSTVLAYCAGFTLAVAPLMRRTGLSFGAIWIGEGLSIGVMEIVMNAIDYQMGGMRTGSVFNMRFWSALLVATAIAFLIAWPVNAWLIAKKIKEH
jgi:hypothetical protein